MALAPGELGLRHPVPSLRLGTMKVLIVANFRSQIGGIQEFLVAEASGLRRLGWDVTVCCPAGLTLRRLAADGFATEAFDANAAGRLGRDFDLVSAHPGESALVSLAVADAIGAPLVLTYHNIYNNPAHHRLIDYVDRVAAVVAVSPSIRDRLVAEGVVPPARLHVIPNGVDLARFAGAAPSAPGDVFRVLTVSRLAADKRQMIGAFQAALTGLRDGFLVPLRWTFVGDGPERAALQELANCTPPSVEIVFAGQQANSRVAGYLADADVFVGPGRSAMEAMACGVPVIAVASGRYVGPLAGATLWEALYTNFGGFAYRLPPKPPRLLEDLQALAGDSALRARMAETGRELVETLYSERTVAEARAALFRAVLVARPEAGLHSPWTTTPDGDRTDCH